MGNRSILLPSLLVLLVLLLAGADPAESDLKLLQNGPPNIVLIVTDDQDVMMGGGLEYMPKLKRHIREEGATFEAAFATTPVCCPSRSVILTGRYIHNLAVVNNSLPGNCAGVEWRDGPEKMNLGWRLKDGTKGTYRTGFFGKYLNMYGWVGVPEPISYVPRGWDRWVGMQTSGTLYNYSLSIDGKEERHGDQYDLDYLTDLLGRRSLDFIKESVEAKQPFFAMVTPTAPHDPADPAPQYSALLPGLKAPHIPSYDATEAPGAPRNWLIENSMLEDPMDSARVYHSDLLFRRRALSLMSVDDMVGTLVAGLHDLHALHNTYIIYTSDHGYHLGSFGIVMDKRLPYETDIRVPFFVRGPGVSKNLTIGAKEGFATLVDLAPTVLDMAGLDPWSTDMDGRSLLHMLQGHPSPPLARPSRRDFLIEYHGEYGTPACERYANGAYEGTYSMMRGADQFRTPPYADHEEARSCFVFDARNNTYYCVRTVTAEENTIFCRYDDAKQTAEFFDLATDPFNMVNRIDKLAPEDVKARDARLAHLRRCSTDQECAGSVKVGRDRAGSLRSSSVLKEVEIEAV